jgi:hypothetical protein
LDAFAAPGGGFPPALDIAFMRSRATRLDLDSERGVRT